MSTHEECERMGIARWAVAQLLTYGTEIPPDVAAYVTERFGTSADRSVLQALAETAGVPLTGDWTAIRIAAARRQDALEAGQR